MESEPPPPRLMDQLRRAIRLRHYSYRTEQAYCHWVERLVYFHKLSHPKNLGEAEVAAFLTDLAMRRNVAPGTQNQALNALVYLYKHVLEQPLGHMDSIVWARPPRRLPVVFSKAELARIGAHLDGVCHTIAGLMYGSVLRLTEALRLRVKDVDFDRPELFVREGKGKKDRVTVLPEALVPGLKQALKVAERYHQIDLAEGYDDVELPYALLRKHPRAATELAWKFLFPSYKRSTCPRTGAYRRHHISPDAVQRDVKKAIRSAGIHKQASCHTLRHSFATHLLEDG